MEFIKIQKLCFNIYLYQKGSRTRFGIFSLQGENFFSNPLKDKGEPENGSSLSFLFLIYNIVHVIITY